MLPPSSTYYVHENNEYRNQRRKILKNHSWTVSEKLKLQFWQVCTLIPGFQNLSLEYKIYSLFYPYVYVDFLFGKNLIRVTRRREFVF